jgi:DNA-binding HxlR family transcriptional regulator
MPRNVRTYDHFCLLARALERVGDRWSLLIVRDLLSGPKRFTDLMDRLGGITPKTLSQRLRELDDAGVLEADRTPGRREVWYHLTPAGEELAPAIDTLAWWAWRHSWHPPDGRQPVHPEHLLLALRLALQHEAGDRAPARWHLRFLDDGEYVLASDGHDWSLASASPADTEPPADVTATIPSAQACLAFLQDPTIPRAADLGIEITGSTAAIDRFERLVRTFRKVASASTP